MKTRIIVPTKENIYFLADYIKKGGVFAVPTETVYGLCASAFDETAVKKIFEIKKRPLKKPLSCNISSLDMLCFLTFENSSSFLKLAKIFWPGPLTIVVEKKNEVLDIVAAGKKTVAIRFSSNKILRKLTELVGSPLVIPSANVSGKKSPTTANEVNSALKGKIEIIIDGGKSEFEKESTIISLKGENINILREGVIKKSMFKDLGLEIV